MGSTDTRMLLSNSFLELAERMPIDKISVSDIVAASGKNRKTFYYHFEDKGHLIRWVFRHDLATLLRERFNETHLVYESEADSGMAELPYYVFKKSGVRSLDGSEFIRALADTFQRRRPYYSKALRATDSDSLRAYLIELYARALKQDIRFILSNRPLSEDSVDFLSEFYAGALISYLAKKVTTPGNDDIFAHIKPFQNIIHASLEHEIKEQQLQRAL